MKLGQKALLIPLLALLITGCTLSPSKPKKKKSSSEGYISSETSAVPTSSQIDPSSQTSITPPTSETPVIVDVTGVEISGEKDITKFVGDLDFVLSYEVSPSNATDKSVTWESSNPSVATVDSATVSIKGAGSTTITVTTNDQHKTDSINLTVYQAKELVKTPLKYDYDDYQTHNVYGLDNCPLSGTPKLLVIPIWFQDSTYFIAEEYKESVRSDIEKAYVGTEEDTGWRSVSGFYTEESMGKCNLQATVADWYEVTNKSTYYGDDDNGLARTTALVDTAVTDYFKDHSDETRKDYDTNGDGYMDGVMLIYGAADYRENPQAGTNLWGYCYWTGNYANVYSPTTNVFFWASYDFMYDHNNAEERSGESYYGSGDCSHCIIDAHCFIHEMGHVFGLEDYYDYYSTGLTPAGDFNMQDNNIGGHDPYSVMAYGWANPYIPTETNKITINDFQSSHDVILLANHDVDSPFDEYLLLELYSPTGLNKFDSDHAYGHYIQGPTQVGIRLWHIDARLTYVKSYTSTSINWSKTFITDPDNSLASIGVYHVMKNSYGGGQASPLGSDYYNFNLLQFIRNDTSGNYRPNKGMTNSDLFYAGDTFDMSTYEKQFYKTGKMNSDEDLGWTFKVESIENNQATITVIKAN